MSISETHNCPATSKHYTHCCPKRTNQLSYKLYASNWEFNLMSNWADTSSKFYKKC